VRLGTEVAADDFQRLVEAFKGGAVKPFQGRGESFAQAIAESTWGLQVITAKKLLPGSSGPGNSIAGLAARFSRSDAAPAICSCCSPNRFRPAQCVGVDIDRESLDIARRQDSSGRLRRSRAGAPRDGRCSDAAWNLRRRRDGRGAARNRTAHPATVVKESAAALRPGGWMLIVDETYPSTLEEMRKPEFKFPLMTGFEELYWGNVLPTREEQEKLLRDAGLTGAIQRTIIGEGFTVLAVQKT
jgi:SAM-dependent methyltransferase